VTRIRIACLAAALLAVPGAFASGDDRCIVIDAGHGGTRDVDESSANNATSPSGIKEKDLTLEVARDVFAAIQNSAEAKRLHIVPIITRTTDVNVGMTERARIAVSQKTKAFVSIHFNASGGHNAHGPLGMVQDAGHGNPNVGRDGAYANFLADAVSSVTQRYDPKSRRHAFLTDHELKGGRGSFLLRHLHETPQGRAFPACFLEIEFIDNPEVEAWLVKGEKAKAVRLEIAEALANALIAYVRGEMTKPE
jgi:N-acetylmuramoyl-L-alanine amidase